MKNVSLGQRLDDLRADLMIEVVTKGEGADPVRGFRAVDLCTAACKKLSAALVPDATFSLNPLVIVEDIEAHSVIAWLRQQPSVDVQLDRPAGSVERAMNYVNRGIVESVKWLTKFGAGMDFNQLIRSLANFAEGSSYAREDSAALLQALCELQQARAGLSVGDRIHFVVEDEAVMLDSSSFVSPVDLLRCAARWHLKNEATAILLVVHAPDYSGGSVWKFEHNGTIVEVGIDDKSWLRSFSNRKIDVRQGDVLSATANVEQFYAADGGLMMAEIRITSVLEVVTSHGVSVTRIDPMRRASNSPAKSPWPSANNFNLSYASPTGLRSHDRQQANNSD